MMSRPPAVTKYHQVAEELAARLRGGVYEAALPGERELAAEFDVARVTVRRALQQLEDRGLVLRQPGRGTVALSSRDAPPRRRLLRKHVDLFLDRGRADQRKVMRFEQVAASAAVARALRLSEGDDVLRIVRLRTKDGLPLNYTEAFVPYRLSQGITRAALGRKAFIRVLEEAGVRIGSAAQTVRAEAAPPAIAEVLDIAAGGPVLSLRRVIRDRSGAPVQLLLGWFRADQFEVNMTLSLTDDLTQVWLGHPRGLQAGLWE